ncbi:hypothetical protein ACFX16_009303 [Malus domestica]
MVIFSKDFDKKRIHKCFHKKTVFEARSCVGLRERLANHPGREQSLERVERQLVVKAGPNESPRLEDVINEFLGEEPMPGDAYDELEVPARAVTTTQLGIDPVKLFPLALSRIKISGRMTACNSSGRAQVEFDQKF